MQKLVRLCLLLGVAIAGLPVTASVVATASDAIRALREVSPARGIIHRADRVRQSATSGTRRDHDTSGLGSPAIDGSGNNELDMDMNAAVTRLARLAPPEYGDGVSTPAGASRPGAREVSNAVCHQTELIPNRLLASDYLWQWGQFLDHDIDLTDGADPPEPLSIAIPAGDPFFDPSGTGTVTIAFNRSVYDPVSGLAPTDPREQLNEITGWIDASNVYGSDEERAAALRANDGSGRLATSAGGLLPFNTGGLPNAGGDDPTLFLAGDVRANEQVGLTAMHTLFVREHNRLAARIAAKDPALTGDEIYERARRLVIAQMQIITYEEFLPALLGPGSLSLYRGYAPSVDATIANAFSTAAYRFGHSALSPTLLRIDADGNELAAGHLALRDAFFNPLRIIDEGGIDPLLRGLAAQVCQKIDVRVIDDVRNFLFGMPGSGGFDLASLNIQRGRDHGLPAYNRMRRALRLGARTSFDEISSDPQVVAALASTYGDVEDIDLWVGSLAEDPVPGSLVGELVYTIVRRQFEALRDGDRFWYERMLDYDELREVKGTRLSDIIRRNTGIGREIADDVFHVRDRDDGCHDSRHAGGGGGRCRPCDRIDPTRRMRLRGKVQLGRVDFGGASGDETLKVKGAMDMSSAGSVDIDPLVAGASVILVADDEAAIATVDLPPGEFNGTAGWREAPRRSKWTYTDRAKPATANGVAKMVVQLRDDAMRVRIKAKDGAYPVQPSDVPIDVAVAIGATNGGECGMTEFAPSACTFSRSGTKLRCR